MNERLPGDALPVCRAELEPLLQELFDGKASDEMKARIVEIVSEDRAACHFYARWVAMHVELGRSLGTLIDPTFIVEDLSLLEAAKDVTAREEAAAVQAASNSSQQLLKLGYWRRHRVQFGAVALVLTLLFWVGFFGLVLTRGGGETNPDPSVLPENVVAQITQVRGVAWQEGATQFAVTDLLEQDDEILLAGGFVEITFRNGAVVLLEGPAHFATATSGAGSLEHGRLVARIEKQAGRPEVIPFVIYTPLAEIIDMGTEFGVEAEADGTTQVDVFQGRVEARPRGVARIPRNGAVLLAQGDSARIVPGAAQFEPNEPLAYFRSFPDVISIDFEPTNHVDTYSGSQRSPGGLVPLAGQRGTWNRLEVGGTSFTDLSFGTITNGNTNTPIAANLRNGSGSVTSVAFAFNTNGGSYGTFHFTTSCCGLTVPTDDLGRDTVFVNGGAVAFEFSGLVPFAAYNVRIFGQTDSGDTPANFGDFRIGDAPTQTPTAGRNYVTFERVRADENGRLAGTMTFSGASHESAMTGIQIQGEFRPEDSTNTETDFEQEGEFAPAAHTGNRTDTGAAAGSSHHFSGIDAQVDAISFPCANLRDSSPLFSLGSRTIWPRTQVPRRISHDALRC